MNSLKIKNLTKVLKVKISKSTYLFEHETHRFKRIAITVEIIPIHVLRTGVISASVFTVEVLPTATFPPITTAVDGSTITTVVWIVVVVKS